MIPRSFGLVAPLARRSPRLPVARRLLHTTRAVASLKLEVFGREEDASPPKETGIPRAEHAVISTFGECLLAVSWGEWTGSDSVPGVVALSDLFSIGLG